jgi:hypothetical protein
VTAAGGWPPCFDFFFSRLNGCRNCPGKPYAWKAKCPAHDDAIQSLSVRVGAKGQLYVRCHAGGLCSLSRILSACGCELDDLFPDNRRFREKHNKPGGKKRMSRTDTVYQYTDESGAVLFEAVRKEPKRFTQRRPNPGFDPSLPADRDANPEYVFNLEGVRLVPYNLPGVLAALARHPEKIVLVVEGEKDVETARAAGITATTNPMGAGKWRGEYSQFLKGAHVVVIPDNDEPGKAHARAVCESLSGVARSVRYVELPGLGEKEDFSDWWTRHLTGTVDQKKAELGKVVKAAKLFGGAAAVPTTDPAGTTPAPAPQPAAPPKVDPPQPAPAPPKADPGQMTAAEVVAAERAAVASHLAEQKRQADEAAARFPNSPTIRHAAGLSNPPPGAAPAEPHPVPVDVPPERAARTDPGPIPADRAVRVAAFLKDAKATAAALKAAGASVKSPMEFYAAMKLAGAQLDQVFTLSGGVPTLDASAMGQVALLVGAYLLQAAADFGLGVGILAEEKAA